MIEHPGLPHPAYIWIVEDGCHVQQSLHLDCIGPVLRPGTPGACWCGGVGSVGSGGERLLTMVLTMWIELVVLSEKI